MDTTTIIFIVLGLLGLDIIIILVLVQIITHIINSYIGTDQSPRFIKWLAVIAVIEGIVSFAVIAPLVVYGAIPYLFKLPSTGFYEGYWIVSFCVVILLTLPTTLLAFAYYRGYKYGFELAREKYEVIYS